MIKTKLIATYGPSLEDYKVIKEVISRIDILRINFSHGNREYWLRAARAARQASEELGKEIALLADLPGPKARLSELESRRVRKGETLFFAYGKAEGDDSISVNYRHFSKDAKKGTIVEIGDGAARFSIVGVKAGRVECVALNDGYLSSKKGISLMGVAMGLRSPTAADYRLARFAMENGFDYLGISFVRSPEDIRRLRKRYRHAAIIAKIETREAVERIDEIASEADAVMVARGDMALEVGIEHIPEMQGRVISAARKAGKPVIVATQLLASMVSNATPTRAEVNDISGAVAAGVDCLMLSDETAIGRHPVEAVEFLQKAAGISEKLHRINNKEPAYKMDGINTAVAFAAARLVDRYKTDCIFVPTSTGKTARLASLMRPATRVIALANSARVRKLLSIYHGIRCMHMSYSTGKQMQRRIRAIAMANSINNYIILSGSGGITSLSYVEKPDRWAQR